MGRRFKIRSRSVKRMKGCMVFYLTGKFGTESYSPLQRRVVDAIRDGYISLVFKFTNLDMPSPYKTEEYQKAFVDFFGSLSIFTKIVDKLGGEVVLIDVPTWFRFSFEHSDMGRLFEMRSKGNLRQALRYFQRDREPAGFSWN